MNDTAPVWLTTISVIANALIFLIVSYKLSAQVDEFTWLERVGMGLTAAGSIMTIGPITAVASPFDDWSTALMRVGIALYFLGRLTRRQVIKRAQRRRLADNAIDRG